MKKIKVTLKKSVIGCDEKQRRVVKGLGLKKVNNSVILPDTPDFRGMINKVSHLLDVKEVLEA
ncbi:MAG: 50S ribosomal protein L30 [bacterium]